MANPEHVKMLSQGVEAWNKWRAANPGILPDLKEADFRGAGMSGANLDHAFLTSAHLGRADLRGAKLAGARGLTAAQLSRARTSQTTTLPSGAKGPFVQGVGSEFPPR
jgi:hypothetical protein